MRHKPEVTVARIADIYQAVFSKHFQSALTIEQHMYWNDGWPHLKSLPPFSPIRPLEENRITREAQVFAEKIQTALTERALLYTTACLSPNNAAEIIRQTPIPSKVSQYYSAEAVSDVVAVAVWIH